MTAVRRLLVALVALALLGFNPGSALAHGEKPHSEPETEVVEDVGAQAVEAALSADPADPSRSLLTVLENAHPAFVHFPIALLLMAAILEALAMLGLANRTERTVELLLYGATIGAILAAVFGWVHTGLWIGGDLAMQLHRWTGTALVLLTGVLALIARAAGRGRTDRRTLLRLGLLIGSVALLLQGYWGGELAHGEDHLLG